MCTAQLATINEIKKTVVLIEELLKSPKEYQLMVLTEGICSYLRDNTSTGLFTYVYSPLYLPNVFKRWKEFSGNAIYPIKAPESVTKRVARSAECKTYNCFRLQQVLTPEEREEYFSSRLRLLQHIQQELKTYLSRM